MKKILLILFLAGGQLRAMEATTEQDPCGSLQNCSVAMMFARDPHLTHTRQSSSSSIISDTSQNSAASSEKEDEDCIMPDIKRSKSVPIPGVLEGEKELALPLDGSLCFKRLSNGNFFIRWNGYSEELTPNRVFCRAFFCSSPACKHSDCGGQEVAYSVTEVENFAKLFNSFSGPHRSIFEHPRQYAGSLSPIKKVCGEGQPFFNEQQGNTPTELYLLTHMFCPMDGAKRMFGVNGWGDLKFVQGQEGVKVYIGPKNIQYINLSPISLIPSTP